jgi:hypothetical protein
MMVEGSREDDLKATQKMEKKTRTEKKDKDTDKYTH